MSLAFRRVLLALILAGSVLNYADRQIIAVLKPMLQQQFGWSDIDYGFLASVFQFASAAAYLVAGWFVDRVGWRWANPLAVGSWSLAAVAHGLVTSFGQFTIARLALGLTEALGTPAAVKTVAVWYRAHERSLALGIMNAAGNVGAIVTPLLVPALALAAGWRAAFIIMGASGLVVVAAWVPLTAPSVLGRPPMDGAPQIEKAPLRETIHNRSTWAIAGAKALSDQVWWFLLFWMPDLFHRVFHLDMTALGGPVALVYALAASGSLLGGWASGRLIANGWSINRARKTVLLVSALLVTPTPMLLLVDNVWLAALMLGVTLAAHQGFSVNIFAAATDIVPARRVGGVISIGALCGNIAGMLILQIAGFVLAAGLGYGPLLALTAVSYLLALGWLQWLEPELKPANLGDVGA